MSEGKTVTLKPVDLVEPEPGFSSSHLDPADTSYQPPALDKTPGQPDLQGLDSGHPGTEEKGPVGPTTPGTQGNRWTSTLDQFKLKRFFVLRPGTMDQALEDIKALVNQNEDGDVHGVWLMAEVDHWNNERERVVLITDSSLLICKYDFVMLNCEHIQRIPLNFVDRITHGNFSFPQRSLLTREGEGVRVLWDRLREPSFLSKWNPFTTDYPFSTFTYHPVRNIDHRFTALCERNHTRLFNSNKQRVSTVLVTSCWVLARSGNSNESSRNEQKMTDNVLWSEIQSFREQLTEAAQKAHLKQPIPGKANGVLVLNQPLLIESYVGLMSFIGNQNKLGYCLARGNIGF
uniref:tumor protein p63-regulated gene 1 protein n=1 Tax=Oncorhynchus gorbuscha TaxID=8017 RepID=UPI001EAF558D|nr:tumor protein p63-regulated gene 1 protein [Oncorhynchus gorbuscha]